MREEVVLTEDVKQYVLTAGDNMRSCLVARKDRQGNCAGVTNMGFARRFIQVPADMTRLGEKELTPNSWVDVTDVGKEAVISDEDFNKQFYMICSGEGVRNQIMKQYRGVGDNV